MAAAIMALMLFVTANGINWSLNTSLYKGPQIQQVETIFLLIVA